MMLNCSYLLSKIITENTKKNHQKTIKLFPPVCDKQEMNNLGKYVGLWEIFLKPYSNATLDSEVS